jgi:predicted deacylase
VVFDSWVQVGDSVERGQIIGRITDYFGNERQRLATVPGGEVGFLVRSLAINAGDPLLAIIS